ncbi:MAG TPA: RNA 2',3'-cyclic phosphodiesterase [Chloroflexota bacterium]|nr:RNA 2',3'-cyclic phosphodiesterase [Chloroflexota bacterium]
MAEDGALRLFLAVDVNDEVRRLVVHAQHQLGPFAPGVRWVAPELCHLTLKFLGWVQPGREPAIRDACAGAAARRSPFELAFGDVGAFPEWRRPRVMWLGITAGLDDVRRLQHAVEGALNAIGFPPDERGFSPHLTLGRFKAPPNRGAGEQLAAVARTLTATERVQVASVQLMRSVLRPSGPEYSVLRRFALSGPQFEPPSGKANWAEPSCDSTGCGAPMGDGVGSGGAAAGAVSDGGSSVAVPRDAAAPPRRNGRRTSCIRADISSMDGRSTRTFTMGSSSLPTSRGMNQHAASTTTPRTSTSHTSCAGIS